MKKKDKKNKNKEEKQYTIILKEKEYKLLMSILEEAEDDRSNMTCNDPYKYEEKLFSKKERIEISKQFYDNEETVEDMDGFLFNCQYVEFIIDKIKSQKKKPSVFNINDLEIFAKD